MSNEEKIQELESRIEKLEKIENRRKIMSIITICIYGVIVLSIIGVCIYFYFWVKPYKDKVDALTNWGGSKIDQIEDGINSYDPFDFDSWFNY